MRNLSTDSEEVNDQVDRLLDQPYSIHTRLRLLVAAITNGESAWSRLAKETGVPAEKWRQFVRGSTRASAEMIEAVGQKWPQYALWLVTGVSDEKHGHHAPHPMWSFPNFDPDAENDPNGSGHYEKTTEFFRLAAHLASTAWQAGPPRQSMNESGDCKVQSLNRKDKHFERNFTLLQTLWELKEKEFLANNSQYDTTSP